MTTDPIDYSRPVGWWCPVCTRCAQLDRADDLIKLGLLNCCPSLPVIPRYLPIPEGQRPPAASEVEEAEVVTLDMNDGECWYMDTQMIYCVAEDGDGWTFNDIAQASARARIVTGATE